MSTAALSLPDLPSQPHQGVGARLVRRLGGAVRSAITGGMTLATGRRRPAAPQPDIDHPVARDPDPRPAPAPEHLPGQPRTASPVTPDRSASPGWLARLSGRGRRPTRFNYALLPDGDAPFTPEAFPGLTPEFCTFLNTPLEECDPEMLTLLYAVLAEHIAAVMPAEAGMGDAGEVFSKLWGRLAAAVGDAVPAAGPAVAPPDAPVAAPDPLAAASPAEALPHMPAEALADVPLMSTASLPEALAAELSLRAQRSNLPESSHLASGRLLRCAGNDARAQWETAPDTTSLPGSVLRRCRPLFASRSFRYGSQPLVRCCLQLLHFCRSLFRGLLSGGPRRLPLPRPCYAARASPT